MSSEINFLSSLNVPHCAKLCPPSYFSQVWSDEFTTSSAIHCRNNDVWSWWLPKPSCHWNGAHIILDGTKMGPWIRPTLVMLMASLAVSLKRSRLKPHHFFLAPVWWFFVSAYAFSSSSRPWDCIFDLPQWRGGAARVSRWVRTRGGYLRESSIVNWNTTIGSDFLLLSLLSKSNNLVDILEHLVGV